MEEYICDTDGREYEYSFKVVGHFIGDEGETINKKRILDVHYMTSKESAWGVSSKGRYAGKLSNRVRV